MKTKFTLLLAIGLNLGVMRLLAQNTAPGAEGAAPVADTAAAKAQAPADDELRKLLRQAIAQADVPATVAPAAETPAASAPAAVAPAAEAPLAVAPATDAPPAAAPVAEVAVSAPAPVAEVSASAPAPAEAPQFAQAKEPAAATLAATEPGAAGQSAPGDLLPLIMFEEAPLNDAIKTLARQAGINFQFDPRVATPAPGPDGKPPAQPTVSIRFENVTAQQALEAVLANHNLSLITDVKTHTSRVTIKDPAAPDPLITKIIQLKYTNPTNLVAVVKATISTRGSVTTDIRTSKLIVVATEKDMLGVDSLVESLDSPTRQVLIEARILETSRAPSTIKGIDWTGTLQAQKFSFGNNALAGVASTPPQTIIDANGNPLTVPGTPGTIGGILSDPKLLADTAKGFNPATAFLNADGVSAVLSFLNTDSDTEVVATPRAVTLDNEKATLSVTRAFPIFNVTPGSANSPAGSQVVYTNLGTILEVTPRISANNTIALKVVPEVSNIDSKDSQTINGAVNIANVYAIRRIEANVVIPSGNTLVMGGLISDTKTKLYTKVPLLGDLPWIGLAFRHEAKSRNKANLLIFITPTVVADNDFHPTKSDFLQNRLEEKPDVEETPWDSGRPKDWRKKTE